MSCEVRFAPAAARQFRELDQKAQKRSREGLAKLSERAGEAASGQRGGNAVKSLRGRGDSFYRPRVGDHRVLYDLIDDERVILVLGIVHRRDLERWLRGA